MGGSIATSRGGRAKKTLEETVGTSKHGREAARSAPPRVNEAPEPPSHMTPIEREVWMHLKKVLTKRGQFSLDNQTAIWALVSATAEFIECRHIVNTQGRTYRVLSTAATRALRPGEMEEIEWGDEHYLTKLRPEVTLLFQADRRMRMWLCEFGLTDATRMRVASPKDEETPEGVLGAYGLN